MRLPTVLSAVAIPVFAWGDLLSNGDFEDLREHGWTYRGTNDGSHGVFSEPTRPGTHSYMLQLGGGDESAESAIFQKVALEAGKTYQLSLEVYDNVPPDGSPNLRQAAFLDGKLIFERNPQVGQPETGWYRRQATFRAQRSEAEILIQLSGRAPREQSTTLIDNVRLVEVDLPLPGRLLRGKPLKLEEEHRLMAVAIGYRGPQGEFLAGYEPLERHRDFTGEFPPLCFCPGNWDAKLADTRAFSALIPKIQPWADSGVTPIVVARAPFERIPEIGDREHDNFFRAWARQARAWGYPLILQPWAGMNRKPGLDSGDFVRAWRRIFDIFEAEDARNVRWLWSPGVLTAEARRFFPGAGYVDIVGCEGADPAAVYAEHLAHTAESGFAFCSDPIWPDPLPPWLLRDPKSSLQSYPRAVFYALPDLESIESHRVAAEAYAKLVASPWARHRLPQVSPPLLRVTFQRVKHTARVTVENLGGVDATAQSRLEVQFWSRDPRGGALEADRVGQPRTLTLEKGEQRALKQDWSGQGAAKVYVSVDRSGGETFLSGISDKADKMVFIEP